MPEPAGLRHRGFPRAIAFLAILLLAAALSVVSAAWINREAVAARVARKALDARGLIDLYFRISHLSPTRLVIEGLALGDEGQFFYAERVEALFTVRDLLRGHVGRVSVEGVSTRLIVDGASVTSPLLERLRPVVAAEQGANRLQAQRERSAGAFTVGAVVLSGVALDVELAGGTLLSEMKLDAGVVYEAAGRYRFWCGAVDDQLFRFKADGRLNPLEGAIAVNPELRLLDIKRLYNIARLIAPDRTEFFGLIPEKGCTVTARGTADISKWRVLDNFEVSAALGRESSFRKSGDEIFARVQSARLEAEGEPDDIRCRVSAGVSAFSFKDLVNIESDRGRLLGMRGSARWRRAGGVEKLDFTVESALPGRSLSQILPGVLPLVPIFFSDGGSLSVKSGLERGERGVWSGIVDFAAEALRSSAPVTAGRVGCGKASLTGALNVSGGRAGSVSCELALSDGYLIRRGLNARGQFDLKLKAEPPYAAASGSFSGRVTESVALPRAGVSATGGHVPFEGEVTVTGLVANPVWDVDLRVPETGVAGSAPDGQIDALGGARAALRYGGGALAAEGEVWLRDMALMRAPDKKPAFEAGLGSLRARFKMPPFELASVSNMLFEAGVSWRGGRFEAAGADIALEDLEGEINAGWSPSAGLTFCGGERLAWRRLEAQGLRALPEAFSIERCGGEVAARLAVDVEGCAGGFDLEARLPVADARQSVLHVTLPEMELGTDGVIADAIRARMPDLAVTGMVSAEAALRFLGTQPHVLGRVKIREGHLTRGDMDAEGVTADVAFESGVFFRTIERPVVTFKQARAGKLKLDAGRLEFHLSPKELFVDRFEAGWCKGRLNAYSVHLDFKNPKDDFIVYADRIDLGEALMMALPFRGQIEGYLYGRFPVGFDRGRVKLYNGFLYSLPGQSGMLRLDDSSQMLELLEKAGVRGDVQGPLAKALSDMDFSSARLDLETLEGGQGVLKIKLDGKSNYKEWPAPVDLNLNLRGPMEDLLNMGLDISRK